MHLSFSYFWVFLILGWPAGLRGACGSCIPFPYSSRKYQALTCLLWCFSVLGGEVRSECANHCLNNLRCQQLKQGRGICYVTCRSVFVCLFFNIIIILWGFCLLVFVCCFFCCCFGVFSFPFNLHTAGIHLAVM